MEEMLQEKLQNYGFFRIILKSLKVLLSQKKLYAQLAISLLLPFSIVFLTYNWVWYVTFDNVLSDEDSLTYKKIYLFLLANLACVSILIPLAFFWIAASIYAVACAFSNKSITFRNIIHSVPKIWKRLAVTYLWIRFLIFFLDAVVVGLLFCLSLGWKHMVPFWRVLLLVIIFVFYALGTVYIITLWGIASVVSVLEDVYGRKSIVRAKKLVRGKIVVAGVYVVLLVASVVGIEVMEGLLVVFSRLNIGLRVLIGVVCVGLFLLALLVAPVFQSILYLVCMSYHQQAVDLRLLSDHLEAYRGPYLHLQEASIEMDRVQRV